jgi:rubredoxin
MENDYIKREEVFAKISHVADMDTEHPLQVLRNKIEDINAADVEPVIRCKECKHAFRNEHHPNKPLICGLTKMCGLVDEDWFCADGERKEQEHDTDEM